MTDIEEIRKRNERRKEREQWPDGPPTADEPFRRHIMHISSEAADIDTLLAAVDRLRALSEGITEALSEAGVRNHALTAEVDRLRAKNVRTRFADGTWSAWKPLDKDVTICVFCGDVSEKWCEHLTATPEGTGESLTRVRETYAK